MADLHPIIREIRQRRISLGLTQTAVAKIAGISKTAVCEIESGNHKPNLDTLIGLARGVGLVLSLDLDSRRHEPYQVCRSCGQPWPCIARGYTQPAETPGHRDGTPAAPVQPTQERPLS